VKPESHFIWLTGGSQALIDNLMSERGVAPDQYSVRTVAPTEVSAYLSAADAGIAFYKPTFSRQATSPVKVSEYLACGLPVIINAGVGDSDTFVSDQRVGAVVSDFSDAGYQDTLAALIKLLSPDIRAHARQVAERFLDVRQVGVQRYARLYEKVLNGAGQLN
jgi:glycosyltransferase involved in cell wall biosynthesis